MLLLLASLAHAKTEWTCFVVDRLPDVEAAARWRGARKMTESMNLVAPNAPAGSTVAVGLPTFFSWTTTPVVYVKK